VASGASIIDGFVRKYGTGGSIVWTRQFGTGFPGTKANTVATSGGAVYVSGRTYGVLPGQVSQGNYDAYVRRYDQSGNLKWTRQLGSTQADYGNSVSVTASGVYVAGETWGTLAGQQSKGVDDAYLRKYNHSGTLQWTRQFGTGKYDAAYGVHADSSGIYVAGDTDGALSGSNTYPDLDAYVRKYNASGTHTWTKQYGSSKKDSALGVAASSGFVYAAGYTGNTVSGLDDATLRKYSSSGTFGWSTQFGGSK
jgi:hypothetical protein